jgi:hypothetical protein
VTHRHPVRLIAAMCAAIVLSGCSAGSGASHAASHASSASPSAVIGCAAASSELVASVQRYVADYGTTLASPSTSSASPSSPGAGGASSSDGARLQAAVRAAQRSVAAGKCSLATFRTELDAGLRGVKADGPIARAVLLKLTASLDGSARAEAQTLDVPAGADLRRVVAGLAAGSTMRLAAGSYALSDTLVLLDSIIIVGAGTGSTTIRTTAGGAGVIDLTDGRVALQALAIVHSGTSPADVVIGGPTSSLELTDVRVSGATATGGSRAGPGTPAPAPPAGTSDGIGVMMSSSTRGGTSTSSAARATTLEMTRSTVDHNEGGGVILVNGQAASLRDLTVTSNGGCGVCFSGNSTGAVRGSRFTDNTVGAAVLDTAAPAMTSDVFHGGEFAIQVAGSATPDIEDATISGATRGAMIFTGTAAGKVDRSRCTGVPYGIVVGPKALPYLGTNSCAVAKGS